MLIALLLLGELLILEGQGASMSALKSDAIDDEGLVSPADDATEECNEQRCSMVLHI